MKLFIRSASCISPQKTFGGTAALGQPASATGDRMNCQEPDYAGYIDPKAMRRMSRIIRMGVTTALECLRNSSTAIPDAIITGTAYGCLEDTEIFLTKLVENKEELLTPTAFIQSTHNTVGAQIALLLKCHNYNNTFVHRGFSFENALLDAMLLLQEAEAQQVLVGAVDEITAISHQILRRFGLYKRQPEAVKGSIAGEGAAFFLLSSTPDPLNLAQLVDMESFYQSAIAESVEDKITSFLRANDLRIQDIDLVILGNNQDQRDDRIYAQLQTSLFKDIAALHHKIFCGEYPTSTAFALWLAAQTIHGGTIPLLPSSPLHELGHRPKTVLIYNHYLRSYHSLYLVSAC